MVDRLEGSSIGPPGAPPGSPENLAPLSWGGVRPSLFFTLYHLPEVSGMGSRAPGAGSKIEGKEEKRIPIVGPGIVPQGILVPQRKEGKDENPE